MDPLNSFCIIKGSNLKILSCYGVIHRVFPEEQAKELLKVLDLALKSLM